MKKIRALKSSLIKKMELITKTDLETFKSELFYELTMLMNKHQPLPPRFLNSAQVREIFQISETKLYELRRDGKIPFIKVDGKFLYDYEEVVKEFRG